MFPSKVISGMGVFHFGNAYEITAIDGTKFVVWVWLWKDNLDKTFEFSNKKLLMIKSDWMPVQTFTQMVPHIYSIFEHWDREHLKK